MTLLDLIPSGRITLGGIHYSELVTQSRQFAIRLFVGTNRSIISPGHIYTPQRMLDLSM